MVGCMISQSHHWAKRQHAYRLMICMCICTLSCRVGSYISQLSHERVVSAHGLIKNWACTVLDNIRRSDSMPGAALTVIDTDPTCVPASRVWYPVY